MADKHSKYSPSAAKIWLNCPKAVHIYSELPSAPPSAAAEEGTKHHENMEKYLLKHGVTGVLKMDYNAFLCESGFVRDRLSAYLYIMLKSYFETLPQKVKIHLEKKLLLDCIIPGCFGTADGVIIHGNTLVIFDYKFGYIYVPSDSEQLILYAIGARKKFETEKKKFEKIETVVFQPKINQLFSRSIFTAGELDKIEKKYVKNAARILKKDPKPVIGPWCDCYAKCQPYCSAYKSQKIADTQEFFKKIGI